MDRDAQRIQQQQQQQQQDRQQGFDQSQARPPSGAESGKGSSPAGVTGSGCLDVHELQVVGMTRYHQADFVSVLAPLKGQCVGVAAINAALHAITDRYVHDGYVTSRAFVGPQNLKDGVLTITVFEGRVGKIEPIGKRPYSKRELAAAFAADHGDILNLRALEQGVDQLARLAGGDPTIQIAPGEQQITSNVEVNRKPTDSWLRPGFAINNNGSASTGRLQATASLDADSPLGLADFWSLYYSHDAINDRRRGSDAWGGFVSLPHGWWTLSLSGGVSDYHTVIEGSVLAFLSNGSSWNASATLDRMVYRDANTKFSLSGGLALVDTANYIAGIQLQTGSYRIVTANITAHWQRRFGNSLIASNIGYSRGVDILGARTVDTGPGGATGTFNLISGDTSVQSRFAVGPTKFTNTLQLRGQWGFDNMFPVSAFSVGGYSTVRGFRDDGISGRTGALLREQLGFGICDTKACSPRLGASLDGYLAYDVGAIRPNDFNAYERGLLQSGTVGAKINVQHFQTDIALSVPISAPTFVRHKGTEFTASLRWAL